MLATTFPFPGRSSGITSAPDFSAMAAVQSVLLLSKIMIFASGIAI